MRASAASRNNFFCVFTSASAHTLAFRSDGYVALFQSRKAQKNGGIHDREQIIDLHQQPFREMVEVLGSLCINQYFQQSGNAAGTRMGQQRIT